MRKILKIIMMLLLTMTLVNGFAQETTDDDNSSTVANKKGFHVGMFIGSYFANQYTASNYDGYGFDFDGNRNSFENSFMYTKIWRQYGGYDNSTQLDQIATALSSTGQNVDYHTWSFDESNMPVNMRYAPAFLLGLQTRYTADKKNAILLNLNAAKLTINGNFTIILPQQATSTQVNNRIQTFAIKGGEQRLLFQLGYQHLFGDSETFNFLLEGGLNVTLAKFDKEVIQINNLTIDLLSNYFQPGFPATIVKRPIGWGFGAFGGLGFNLNMNPKCTVQLVYDPSYESIHIEPNPRLKLQNAIGIRAYYNL
jgi:hypothetical protein